MVSIYSGTFMTSLDMHGFSISLMRTDSTTTALLDEQCKVCCLTAFVEPVLTAHRCPPLHFVTDLLSLSPGVGF